MRPLLRRNGPIAVLCLLALSVGLGACSAQQPPATAPEPDEASSDQRPPQRVTRQSGTEEPLDAGAWGPADAGGNTLGVDRIPDDYVLQTVYFDYDQSEIRADQRAKLQANAQYLRENQHLRVLVGGHADERGTREYNMALGEQRASSTMQYLVALGIPPERIEIISYGEEQPAMTGESESSYAQNRRAEFRMLEGR